MISEMLFDTPWWLPLALIGVGVAVFISGNRRQEKSTLRGGLALMLLGVAVALVSYFIDTPRENAVGRTRGLVAAVNARDWQQFRQLIDPQTTVLAFKGPQAITDAVQSAAENNNVTGLRITGTDVQQAGAEITVSIRVLSEQRGVPGASDWRLIFLKSESGLVLYKVEPLSKPDFDAERVLRELNRGR